MDLLRTVLQDEECDCEVSGTLAATINFDAIKQYAPDLVILDFAPGRDENWRLLNRLRAGPDTSSIPVLAITTLEPLLQESVKSINVRDVLIRPFDLNVLLETVRKILSSPRITAPVVPGRPREEALEPTLPAT